MEVSRAYCRRHLYVEDVYNHQVSSYSVEEVFFGRLKAHVIRNNQSGLRCGRFLHKEACILGVLCGPVHGLYLRAKHALE